MNKPIARAHFLQLRKQLSLHRRTHAKSLLCAQLYSKLASYTSILSFYSLPLEIDTHALNQQLAAEGRLLFPRMQGQHLFLYRVTDLKTQLLCAGKTFFEPDPEKCTSYCLQKSDCALIPALGFDRENFRLGYGKGYYDRLLERCNARSIGVGFYEQLSLKSLPRETHDIPVDELFLA